MSKRTVNHFPFCHGTSQPLDHELNSHISIKSSTAPISSCYLGSFWKIWKPDIGFFNLSLNRFLFSLHHVFCCWKVEGVDRRNILFLLIEILIDFFLSIVLSVPTITGVFGVLFEPTKKDGFMVVHYFTEKYRGEELRVVGEHDFFLDTSST